MKQHLYVSLLEDFCRLTGIPSATEIMRGGTVETEGVRFSLMYCSPIDPDLLFVYCDFLNPPAGGEIDGYRALLTKNLSLYTRNGPVFALSPDTGRVVLAQYLELDGLSAATLADKLISLASTVHDLRHELLHPVQSASVDIRPRRPRGRTSGLLVQERRILS